MFWSTAQTRVPARGGFVWTKGNGQLVKEKLDRAGTFRSNEMRAATPFALQISKTHKNREN